MKANILKFTLISLMLLPSAVLGEVEFLDHAIPELLTSSRSLGSGNANFGEDFGPLTVFLNPASKVPVRKHKFGIFNFVGEFSNDTFSRTFGDRGVSFGAIQQGIDFLSQSNMRTALAENDGGILYQRMGVVSYYQFKRFTIGHFSSHASTGAMESGTSEFFGNRREDHGPYIHYSKLLARKLLFGFTYIYLTRSETFSEFDNVGSTNFNRTFHGTTNHVILAFKYQFTRKFLMSLVSRDAFSSTYFNEGSEGLPNNDPNTIDLAFTSFTFRNKLKLNLALRDISGKYTDVATSRKIQLGGEFSRSLQSGFKFGYLDNGLTLGYFYKTRKMGTYSFSTYSANTKVTGVRAEDRRVTLEFSL